MKWGDTMHYMEEKQLSQASVIRPQAWRWNVTLLPSAGYIQSWEKRTDCLKGQKMNLTQKIIIAIINYAYKTDYLLTNK